LRDGTALRRIVVRAVTNFQVAIGGGTPVTTPATVDLPTPATGDVSVTATRSNAAQAASVQLDVVDVFGNQVSCASSVPASTTPDPQPPPTPKPPVPGDDQVIKRELSGRGRLDIEIVKVSGNMRYVTIRNDRKGLESVEVWVNHKWFLSGRLKDGQVKTLDVSRALVPGKKNRIVLVGRGQRYDSAVVTISAKP
jgi:hypothetical protein